MTIALAVGLLACFVLAVGLFACLLYATAAHFRVDYALRRLAEAEKRVEWLERRRAVPTYRTTPGLAMMQDFIDGNDRPR